MGRFVPGKNFHQICAFAALKQQDYKPVLAGITDFEDEFIQN